MSDNNKTSTKKKSEQDHKAILDGKKKKLIKAVKIVAIVFAVLLVLCGILYLADSLLKGGKDAEKTEHKNSVTNENGGLNNDGMEFTDMSASVDYYEPDYDVDIMQDEEYLAKDRSIRYRIDGNGSFDEGYVLNEEGVAVHNLKPGQRFFLKYFEAIINGDYEAYHEMIADDYAGNPGAYRKNPKNNEFPMQRLYNINIVEKGVFEQGYSYNGKEAIVGMYEVEYSIMKNDGEFRLNLQSDASKKLYYTIITTDAGTEKEKTVLWRVQCAEDLMATQGDDVNE